MSNGLRITATLALLISAPAGAKSGTATTDYPDCGYRVVPVCKAWKIADRDERDREVMRLLSAYLTSKDQFVRRDALGLLQTYAGRGEIDPRIFKPDLDILDTLPDTENDGKRFLEAWAFSKRSRAEREGAYRVALEKGRVAAGEAYEITRTMALEMAANDGCVDLKEQMRKAQELGEGWDRAHFDQLMVLVDLRAGIGNTPEGNRQAVERLASIPTPGLYEHLRDESSWREAIAAVASAVCEKDRDPEACRQASMVVRDVVLYAQEEDRAHLRPFDSERPNDAERLQRFEWYTAVKRGFRDCESCDLPPVGGKR